jgi:hypothetical protein
MRIPWSEPNRTACEAVLALGGEVQVSLKGQAQGQTVKAVVQLPSESFQLTHVRLGGISKPLDDVWPKLAALNDPEFDRLEALDLSRSSVTDVGLKQLHGLGSLREIDLSGTKVTGEGVADLQKSLPNCRVTYPTRK